METEQKIAEIILDIENQRAPKITFYEKKLRFKCQCCAIFCCRLGGPKLSERDIKRLKQMRRNATEFLDISGRLRSKEDGSCIFLKFDAKKRIYKCSVYDCRPTLCRFYPFHVTRSSPNSYTLKLIPCCNGLNVKDSEVVNENFIRKHLLDALLDLSYYKKVY
jgi:Fe-S-cluster containining protein